MAEISLSELPRDLRQLHTRGVEAAQRDNLEYAINLFSQVLEKSPTCHDCRAALRAVQQKKVGGSSGGFFKKMISGAGSSPLIAKGRMALNSNPLEAIHIAEQILNTDPLSPLAHRLVADAADAAEMPHTAVMSLEVLHRNSPDDQHLTVQLAKALAQAGDIQRGEKLLIELCHANPNNPGLGAELKNISALKTLGESGYETLGEEGTGGSYRDILRNKDEAVSLEQEKRAQKSEDVTTRLIGEYETRLHTEPNNLRLIRSLAELYTEKHQFDRALEYYARVKGTEMGNDPALDRAIANTIVRKYDHAIAELNPFAPEHPEQVAQIQAEKLAFQISECQQRVDKYPTDLVIRYELGTLLFQAGKITEAISEFQKAQNNPNKRIGAMNHLAQCFARRGMNDSAVRTLQSALKEKLVLDDEKKDLIYQLGCVFEKMGKKPEAMEQFTILYENDISYKDVGAKVDAFYAGQ